MDGSPRGFNIASPTNVNEIPLALALGLPRDGGFGQIPTVFGSFGNTDDLPPPFGHFEFEEFNSPPVVESADTGPFFHNHTVPDLESAVAFYGSPAFKASLVPARDPGGHQRGPERSRRAGDCRVPARAERAREHPILDRRGGTWTDDDQGRRPARSGAPVARGNRRCAGGVVRGRASRNRASRPSGRRGSDCGRPGWRSKSRSTCGVRWAIDDLLGVALQQLRGARSALANPATLPPSFRN